MIPVPSLSFICSVVNTHAEQLLFIIIDKMTFDVATAIVNHILENIFDKIDMSVNDQTKTHFSEMPIYMS